MRFFLFIGVYLGLMVYPSCVLTILLSVCFWFNTCCTLFCAFIIERM